MTNVIKDFLNNNSKKGILSYLDKILKKEDITSTKFYDEILIHAAKLSELSDEYIIKKEKPCDEKPIIDLCNKGFIDISYIEVEGSFVIFHLNLTKKSINFINELLVYPK